MNDRYHEGVVDGYKEALQQALRDIKEENYRFWGYKRPGWDYVCDTNKLVAKIKARLESTS